MSEHISVRRAPEIDDQNAMFRRVLARVHLARQEYDKGLAELEVAVDLNPNLPAMYCGMGDALNYEGRYQKAYVQFDKALQLGPRDPVRWAYFGYGALARLFAEDFETALTWADNAIRYPNCLYWAYAHKVVALGHLGCKEEAEAALHDLYSQQPNFSIGFVKEKFYFIKRNEQLQLYLEGLRQAGVSE
jgi:tetratricopeptide (TPR) repeat protein